MLLPAEPAIFHRKPFLLDRTVKQILVIQIRRHLVDSFSKMNEVSLSLQDKQMKHLWPMIKLKQRSRKCLFITVSLEDSRYIPKTFQKSISVDIKDTVWHEKKKKHMPQNKLNLHQNKKLLYIKGHYQQEWKCNLQNWEKILANHVFDKVLISRAYKQLLFNNNRNKRIKKWSKYLNKHFSKIY